MPIDFMTDQAEDSDWLRIEEHYPHGADPDSSSPSKGICWSRELLRDIFGLLLAYPEALKGHRGTSFECHQIICLVQAMTEHSASEPWVWDAAKRLSSIRNDLAHNLEPRSLDARVGSLIHFVTHDNAIVRRILDRIGTPEGAEFKAVILAMCGCLSSLKAPIVQNGQAAA